MHFLHYSLLSSSHFKDMLWRKTHAWVRGKRFVFLMGMYEEFKYSVKIDICIIETWNQVFVVHSVK